MKQITVWAVSLVWISALLLAGCASQGAMSEAPPAHFADGVLVNDAGMTLYTFAKDPTGQSTCYDTCAENWPPLLAAPLATPEGKFGIINRKNGTRQWEYEGKPLYLFIHDKKPGEEKGNGLKGVWHVVKNSSQPSAASSGSMSGY